MIPSDIKWDPNATPPQYTNNEDTVIEPGTHVRCKIIGTRSEVGGMWAIGSIKEDYLGYVSHCEVLMCLVMATDLLLSTDAFRINKDNAKGSPRYSEGLVRLAGSHEFLKLIRAWSSLAQCPPTHRAGMAGGRDRILNKRKQRRKSVFERGDTVWSCNLARVNISGLPRAGSQQTGSR